jgi:transposase
MGKLTVASRPVAIGLDISKSVFQVHALDRKGNVVARQKLRRTELLSYFKKIKPCNVAMESCASSHHWGRAIGAMGHKMHLINPRFVAPLVKSQKNDRNDSEAICAAMLRPGMRFVPVKSESHQAMLMLHRARKLLSDQRTMLTNSLRAFLAEFGCIAERGRSGRDGLLTKLRGQEFRDVPVLARRALESLASQVDTLQDRLDELEEEILFWNRENPQSRLLSTIPGIGPVTASYFAALVPDPGYFRSGRHLSAWLGLVPRQFSTGGVTILGRITKRGDRYLRSLLFIGARNVLAVMRRKGANAPKFILALLAKKSPKLAAIALANKLARIAWAVMTRNEKFSWDRLTAAMPA